MHVDSRLQTVLHSLPLGVNVLNSTKSSPPKCAIRFFSRHFSPWLKILMFAEYPNTVYFFAVTEPHTEQNTESTSRPLSAAQPAIEALQTEKGWQPAVGVERELKLIWKCGLNWKTQKCHF